MPLRYVRELGLGGFGRVFLAVDDVSGRPVAVKELLHVEDPELRRFFREIRLLMELRSNLHVVDLYEHHLEGSPPYFVMEYCEYGSLRSWVGKRPWQDVAKAILNAAMGLSGLHAQGGFHRDVKPDNLLATRGSDGEVIVKVSDFGIARRPTSLSTMTRSPGGTAGYMAPEVDFGGAEFSAAADVYSLGVTAIELLAGTKHRLGEALHSVVAPQDFKTLVARMASATPSRRPSLPSAIDVLTRVLRGRSRPSSPTRSSGSGWLVTLGLLAGAVALAGTGTRSWDAGVERYRDAQGRFRSA